MMDGSRRSAVPLETERTALVPLPHLIRHVCTRDGPLLLLDVHLPEPRPCAVPAAFQMCAVLRLCGAWPWHTLCLAPGKGRTSHAHY